jgi:hypothetical protein
MAAEGTDPCRSNWSFLKPVLEGWCLNAILALPACRALPSVPLTHDSLGAVEPHRSLTAADGIIVSP